MGGGREKTEVVVVLATNARKRLVERFKGIEEINSACGSVDPADSSQPDTVDAERVVVKSEKIVSLDTVDGKGQLPVVYS